MAIVQVNPARRQQQAQRQEISAIDQGLDRLLKGLQIASTGYGISVNMDRAEALRAQTAETQRRTEGLPSAQEAESKRALERGLIEEQTRTQQQKTAFETARTAGEQQATKLEAQKFPVEQQKREAEAKIKGMDLEKLETEMAKLRTGGRGVTDFGEKMSQAQLVSQSFLDRGVKAADRMKELSPQISVDIMDESLQAMQIVEDMPIIGDGVTAINTLLGSERMQQLRPADKQYLINLYEVAGLILRDETGAAQTADEVAKKMLQLSPRAGETSQELELKAQILQDSLAGLRTKTGKEEQALTNKPDISFDFKTIKAREGRERRGEQQQEQARIERNIEKELGKADDTLRSRVIRNLQRNLLGIPVPDRPRRRQPQQEQAPTGRGLRGVLP